MTDEKYVKPFHRHSPLMERRPIEKVNMEGTRVFETTDHTKYQRAPDGSIRRVQPKVNGKTARRLRRQMRGSR